jgi:hypothetical protein
LTTHSLSGKDAGNYNVIQLANVTGNISKANLTVSGMTASNKVYDGTVNATLASVGSLQGVVAGDFVALGAVAAMFSDKNAGTGKTVEASVELNGADSGNYNLQAVTLSADIEQASITLGNISARNRVYDGTRDAVIRGTPLILGLISGDDVSVAEMTGLFKGKNVGVNKTVVVSAALSGADASNYKFSAPIELKANVTKANLTLSGLSANEKVYDGNRRATISGTAVFNGRFGDDDLVLGEANALFSDRNAGTLKTVITNYTLSGDDARNYNLVQPTGMTANITRRSLNVQGITANDKVYDGTVSATLSGVASTDKLLRDNVTITLASASFGDALVGTGKGVTARYTMSGTDRINYRVVQPTGLTANITAR